MIIVVLNEEIWDMSEKLEKFHVILLLSLLIGQISGIFNKIVQETGNLIISLLGRQFPEVAPSYLSLPLQYVHDFLTAVALITIVYSLYLVYEGNLSKSIFLKLVGYEIGLSIILFYTIASFVMFIILLVMIMSPKLPAELANNIPTSGNFTTFLLIPSSLLVFYMYYKPLKRFEKGISNIIHSREERGKIFLNGINLKTHFYFIIYPFALLFMPFLISADICSKPLVDLGNFLTLESRITYATAFTGLAELSITLFIILPVFHSLMSSMAKSKTLKDRITVYVIVVFLMLFLNPYILPIVFTPLYCRILKVSVLSIQLLDSGILSMVVYLLFIVFYQKMISTINKNIFV